MSSESIARRYEDYVTRRGDDLATLRAMAQVVDAGAVLYPESYVHVSPSFVFPDAVYVDRDRVAIRRTLKRPVEPPTKALITTRGNAMDPQREPVAGWYPDTERPGYVRFWDGSVWTQQRALAPSVQPPPPQAPQPVAGFGTHGQPSVLNASNAAADLATPWQRLGAFVLDVLFSILLWFSLATLGSILPRILGSLGELLSILLFLAGLAFLVLYPIMSEGRLGQTYGKHVVGIKVVSSIGRRPIGSGSAFGRGIVRMFGAYFLGLGLLWMLWDQWRQGWHDKAVSSVVVIASGPRLNPVDFVRSIFA